MEPSPMVRDATVADADALARVYSRYVLETTTCFEEERVSAEDMTQRLAEVAAAKLPWLVVEEGGAVLGYAYASKWKGRCAYRFAAETSVYLDPNATRRGLGGRLYTELLARLKASGLHVVIGGIALPNEASIALHERMGFEKVAHFREVGFKFGRWLDVGYWEKML